MSLLSVSTTVLGCSQFEGSQISCIFSSEPQKQSTKYTNQRIEADIIIVEHLKQDQALLAKALEIMQK